MSFYLHRLLKRLDFPSMKFSLYFMGYEKAEDIPTDDKERIRWTFSRKATVELTQWGWWSEWNRQCIQHWFIYHCVCYSNWGTENDPNFTGYHNGNQEPKGFGKWSLTTTCSYIILLLSCSCRHEMVTVLFLATPLGVHVYETDKFLTKWSYQEETISVTYYCCTLPSV